MRASFLYAVAALALALALPAGAGAAPSQLDGSCSFTGPIKPTPGITVVPRSGPHFSFSGHGTCDGHLDGAAVTAAPVTVTFDNVQTVFDTCELGPDVNLAGVLKLARSRFDVTVDLARLVLAGPLRVSTAGGGLGFGSAQFQPGDSSTAPQQCVGAGLDNASLSASFTTVAALVGETVPAASATPGTPPSAVGRGSGSKPKRRTHASHRRRARHTRTVHHRRPPRRRAARGDSA